MDAVTYDPSTQKTEWHVDRTIPLALVITLGLGLISQAGVALWWASGVENRLAKLEDTDKRIDLLVSSRIKFTDERFDRINAERERVVRIEEQVKYIVDTLRRIDGKLDNKTTGGAGRGP